MLGKKRIVISVCSSKGKGERMRGLRRVIRSTEMRNKVSRRKVEVTMVNFVESGKLQVISSIF